MDDSRFAKCIEKSFKNDLNRKCETNEQLEHSISLAIEYVKNSPARFHIVAYLSEDGSLDRAIRRGLEEYSEELLEQIHRCSDATNPCSDYLNHE